MENCIISSMVNLTSIPGSRLRACGDSSAGRLEALDDMEISIPDVSAAASPISSASRHPDLMSPQSSVDNCLHWGSSKQQVTPHYESQLLSALGVYPASSASSPNVRFSLGGDGAASPYPTGLLSADGRRNPLHRSLPSLASANGPFREPQSPTGPTRNSSCSLHRTQRHFVLQDSLDRPDDDGMDVEDGKTNPVGRKKILVRKDFGESDEETETDESTHSSTVYPSCRKRPLRPGSTVKRMKTMDCSAFRGDDDSISSGDELEKFFNSMGLDDQQMGGRCGSRALNISNQVSDDAMESEEEQFESVSIVGGGVLRGRKDSIALIPTVETDDDEPEMPSDEAGSKGDGERGPRPPALSLNGRNEENYKLRNARVYKWLVTCRAAGKK
ncbi:uncharacterized protein LOC129595063 [Paramacrobiotus metropolitanus]|uniref:uncharacterized protein LOC129595063 n=1 Tax=Paramacrobiotus metropolitanus TaxID=2943436 RepID=UPI002446043A|nr:uncharacterized protein LOC129595063 [Paramacrobiotus metropolitanus]